MTAAPILARLEALPRFRQIGPGRFAACCPAHDDRNPSLGWRLGDEEQVLLRCHAGCTAEAIAGALGCALSDLYPPRVHAPAPVAARRARREAEPEAHIDYPVRNRAGEVVAVHRRIEGGGKPKEFRWYRPDGRVGLNGTPAAEVPLYGVHRLGADGPVVLVEGEKAADRLHAAGIEAVGTTTGAAGTPGRGPLEDLSGRLVYLWPDNDEAGRAHMDRIGSALEELATVVCVEWPGAPEHGDAADYLAAGHTADDVRALLAAARAWPAELGPAAGAEARGAWPAKPGDAVYHGLLGAIALAVAPHTEADPIGILGTLLAMFGSACGGARALYQGSLQRSNLSLVLVGESGFRGRKGTALDVARSVFRLAYPELDALWLVGLASGEGITGHFERHEHEERVLVVEPEFGRLLTIMNREGSTLSAVLRNAWDGVPLGHARARDEALVAHHHVTLLGHITPVELRLKLTDADAANGFTNRLLFLAVRRQRLIPFPGSPDDLVREHVAPLRRAIEEAQRPAELQFDAGGRERWEDFYAELAISPRLGLAGAVTGRHEAQVARLALVYALAERSPTVGAAHLEAAIALAEYARRSVTWALGDSTGNRHADALLRMLEDGPVGWDEARRELGLRLAADMAEAAGVLVDAGLAEVVPVAREGGGRPRREIRANGAKGANPVGGARKKGDGSTT